MSLGTDTAFLDINISKFVQGLQTAARQAQSSLKDIDNGLAGGFQAAGSAMMSAGAKLTAFTTVPIAAAGAWGLNIATNFEEGMSAVKAITQATEDEFNGMRETAIQLGADTKYSASEVTEGMTIMAKAGWDATQIMDGMGGVLDAAAASGEDLATVSEVMANTLTGFNINASESAHVADVLAQVANAGTVDIVDLGESFKYCAAPARALGVDFETTSQALLAMSKSGIKGSQAGTTLRRIFTNLTGASESATKALQELGLETTNSDGSFRNFNDILSDCRKKMAGMTEEERAYYAQKIAGQTGMSGFLTLLQMTDEEYAALGEEIANCNGVAQETADIMQDNLANDLEQLGGSLESLAIKLGDLLIPHIRKFVQWLDKMVDGFVKMSPEQQAFILKIAGIVAAIGPALVIFGKLTSTVGKVMDGFKKAKSAIDIFKKGMSVLGKIGETSVLDKFASGPLSKLPSLFTKAGTAAQSGGLQISALGKVFGLLTSPVGIAVAVIGVLVAAFITLWNTSEDFRNAIGAVFEQVGKAFSDFWNTLQGLFPVLQQFGTIFDALGAAWQGFCDLIAGPIIISVFQTIGNFISGLLQTLSGLIEFLTGIFTGDWSMVWQGIQDIFVGAWNMLTAPVQPFIDMLVGLWNWLVETFGPGWNEFWTGVGQWFQDLWNGVIEFFAGIGQGIVDTVTGFCTSVGQWFSDTATGIANWCTDTWNGISEWCGNLINDAVQAVTDWANDVGQWFSDTANNIGTWCSNTWNDISNWCGNLVNDGVNAVTDFANNCSTWFENAKQTVGNFVSDCINRIGNWARDMANNATNAARDFWNNLRNGLQAAVNGVVQIGSNIVHGIWNGISGAAGWLWGQISGFCSNIVNNIKSFFHIGSPSRLMADEVGAPIVQGIEQGVEDQVKDSGEQIEQDIEDMIDNVDTKDKVVNVDVITKFWESGESWRDELLAGFDKFSGNMEHLVDRLMGPDLSQFSESFLQVMKNSAKVLPESEINESNRDLVDALLGRPVGIARYMNGATITGIDYTRLGQEMVNALRQAPIEPDIDIEMQQGDVLLDAERVGRALTPTISRLLVGGNQPLPR